MSKSGHRIVAHSADTTIEAWAPTRVECLTEAVAALTEGFADVSDVAAPRTVPVSFPGGDDLLCLVLEEAVYLLDVLGVVVVSARLTEVESGGVDGYFATVPADQVAQVGPLPKAVTHHGLSLRHDDGGWRATATIDV